MKKKWEAIVEKPENRKKGKILPIQKNRENGQKDK